MKESYLKLTDYGIIDDMKNILSNCSEKVEFKTDIADGFITTAAFINNK